jgi:hypothetical protein
MVAPTYLLIYVILSNRPELLPRGQVWQRVEFYQVEMMKGKWVGKYLGC